MRDILEHLEVRALDATYVLAVAIHKQDKQNTLTRIPCKKCIPLGGYAYDVSNDCLCVRCVDYLALGFIPISYELSLGRFWKTAVPMPAPILETYLTETQAELLTNFKETYADVNKYELDYIQAHVA